MLDSAGFALTRKERAGIGHDDAEVCGIVAPRHVWDTEWKGRARREVVNECLPAEEMFRNVDVSHVLPCLKRGRD